MKFLSLLLLCFSIQLKAADAEYGAFVVVKGKVIIQSKSGDTAAKVNSKVFEGETIITDADSRAKVVMFKDRNILNILPNSKLKIEKLSNTDKDKNVHINLIEGRVRAEVGEKYNNNSSKFQIRTATAVAGVRGTRFITSYEPSNKVTQVITLFGEVMLKRVSMAQGSEAKEMAEVLVGRQQKSEVKEDADPSEPVKVPKKEFDNLNRETEVKTDKNAKNGEGKDGGKGGDKDVGSTPDAGTGGVVGTTPIQNGGGINTTPIIQAPPSTTKVNIRIK